MIGLPERPLGELQAWHLHLLALEPLVRSAAVDTDLVLREAVGRVHHEPREARVQAAEAPEDLLRRKL